MLNRNKVVLSLTLAGALAMAVPTHAASVAESGIADEVNACVAAVRDRMDLSNASHVKHDITAIERRTVGYTLKISTSIFGAAERDAIRAYTATCVVNGDNPPLQFEMAESA